MAGPLLDRRVGEDDHGKRIDRALTLWLAEPRGRVQERLASGQVCVDGAPVVKSARLRRGQRVVVVPAPPEPVPSPPPPVPVRCEDAHVAVVAKPAGLVVHGGSGVRGGTLVDALRAMGMTLARGTGEGRERDGIVHRLDRGTSGLLVVAKTATARDGLVAALRRREVHRGYWVLVDGVPDPPRATVEAPIARSGANRTRFAVDPGGRPAVTHYDVVVDHRRAAELSVRLGTGRTHQIRVHMAAVGHPVTGDRVYGASPLGASLGLTRPGLHARRLAFGHPVTAERIEVTEALPEDLERARAALLGRLD